jgi:hypothetical protein
MSSHFGSFIVGLGAALIMANFRPARPPQALVLPAVAVQGAAFR